VDLAETLNLHSAGPGTLQSGIRALVLIPKSPVCRITLPIDDVESRNYFDKTNMRVGIPILFIIPTHPPSGKVVQRFCSLFLNVQTRFLVVGFFVVPLGCFLLLIGCLDVWFCLICCLFLLFPGILFFSEIDPLWFWCSLIDIYAFTKSK
jgi:hypothetical protein